MSRRSVLGGITAGAFSREPLPRTKREHARTGRYIIGTDGPGPNGEAAARAKKVHHELHFDEIGSAIAGQFPEEALKGLRNRPNVRYVERDLEIQSLAETLPNGIERVDADVAHANGDTGVGAHIAVVDTGIDATHPDLAGNLGEGYAIYDCSSDCTTGWDDDDRHGTHCAGIAGAIDNERGVIGVSTEATLHGVKALDEYGNGYFSDLAEGIRWVTDRGYDVANISVGGSGGASTIRDACRYAYDNGVLLVAAAGSTGSCSDCVFYPAAYDTVIAVSAADGSGTLSPNSHTGPEIELTAPGVDVYSTVPGGYGTESGTSMACPHVAGAGGQLMANGFSNTEARQRLTETAEDLGLPDDEQGAGMIDVDAALGLSGGSDTDPALAISTGNAVNVGETTAMLEGSLDDLGGATSAVVGFEWGVVGSGLPNATTVETRSSTGIVETTVAGLESGTDYEYRAVADVSDGDTGAGGTVSFRTDTITAETPPRIDRYQVTEAGSKNPHAEVTADWTVADTDGDLSSVTVTVLRGGHSVDSDRTPVSGSRAFGSSSFQFKRVRNVTFHVRLTVTDSDDNTATAIQTVSA